MVERQRQTERKSSETTSRASKAMEGLARKALEPGLVFLIWREALSSEGPVGGASGTGVMDRGVVVAVLTPQRQKMLKNTR